MVLVSYGADMAVFVVEIVGGRAEIKVSFELPVQPGDLLVQYTTDSLSSSEMTRMYARYN
jgi:hypothetical protein